MKKNIKDWLFRELQASPAVNSLVGKRVFFARTVTEQQSPLVVFSSFVVNYATTKDCSYADSIVFAVDCIAEDGDVIDALANAVIDAVNSKYIENVGLVLLNVEKDDYIFEQGMFVTRLEFIVNL